MEHVMASVTLCLDGSLRTKVEIAKQSSLAARIAATATKNAELTGVNVAEQSMLLNVLGEICKRYIAHVLYVTVLREETVAADQNENTVQEREGLSGRVCLNQNVRDGDHLLNSQVGTVLSYAVA